MGRLFVRPRILCYRPESGFRRATDSGDGIAMIELADILLQGPSDPVKDQEVATLYQRAADQGLVGAQYKLGLLYEQGRGVTKDPESAYMWYTISETGWHDFNGRKQVLSSSLTKEQIAEAEFKAEEYLKTHHPMIVE